jgi:hypothetical protein
MSDPASGPTGEQARLVEHTALELSDLIHRRASR